MSALLTERYKDDLLGVLSCFDRVVITGTLPGACYAKGMTSFITNSKSTNPSATATDAWDAFGKA